MARHSVKPPPPRRDHPLQAHARPQNPGKSLEKPRPSPASAGLTAAAGAGAAATAAARMARQRKAQGLQQTQSQEGPRLKLRQVRHAWRLPLNVSGTRQMKRK